MNCSITALEAEPWVEIISSDNSDASQSLTVKPFPGGQSAGGTQQVTAVLTDKESCT